MFALAISIGILSYILMGLGLVGWLNNTAIYLVLITWGLFLILKIWSLIKNYKLSFDILRILSLSNGKIKNSWLWILLAVQMSVNFVGALGPELGFDALWYHLTIPKIWLMQHKITFLGGDLYYSGLPKLIDMLYVYPGAQLIHFGFGILTLIVIYKLARKYLDEKYALLACIIFYSNLVVGWQSITAYVDLGRTFFEIFALYLFVNKKYFQTAVVLGLAISSKILALGSLIIFLTLGLNPLYFLISLLIASPWFIFNLINTGNPVYPIFLGYQIDWNLSFNILRLADPINPVYVMVLPLLITPPFPPLRLRGGTEEGDIRTLVVYCILSFIVWFLTPHTGGGRFLMPYLPVWSVLTAILIQKNKFLVSMAIALAIISIGYRGLANSKYIPYLIGLQSKQEFRDIYLYHRFK